MADQAPEVKVKLTAEDTGVAAAIKALGTQLQDIKTKSKDTAGGLSELGDAFDKLISAEIVLKVVEFGKEVFNTSVQIERMSQKTGLSAGLLSTFGKAAESSGASTEQVNTALGRLATNITQFEQGGTKAAAAMKALNLSQSDFKNLSPDEKIRLVTDRLGAMQNGLQKAAIAQQLMGRGGQALLPTLNALAGEGFDEVTKAAIRSGQYLSDEMAADAASAAASFAELEGAGKGIATQFEAGLLPALNDVADALTNEIEEGGASSFKQLGAEAGTVVKTLVLAWQIGANTIGAILLSLYDVVSGQFKQLGNAVETLGEAAIDASRGHFADAGKAIANGFHTGVTLAKTEVDDLKSRWTALSDVVTKSSVALFPDDATAAARQKARESKAGQKTGGDTDDLQDAKADKARLALLQARLQEELALFKANNAQEESANQIAYDEGFEGLRQYFAKRKALVQAEADEQISVLTRERAAIAASPTDGTDATEIAKKQKLAKIDNDIAIAKVQATTKQGQLDQQLFAAEEAHQKTVLGYQAQILAAQGLTYQAAVAQIQSEEETVRRNLVQAGLTPDQVSSMLQQIQQLKLATAAFDEDKKQSEVALKSIADEKESISLRVQTGQISEIQGELELQQLEQQRIPQLQRIAEAMKAAAITPQQKQEAADFDLAIKKIAADADFMGQEFGKFKNQVEQGGISTLSTFLGSTINQVHGVGDAFKQLGSTAISTLQRIAAQLIAEIVIHKLIQAITHQGEGAGEQVASAAAAGAAQAGPLIAASALMSGAGATIIAGGTVLSVSAAQLQIAASTLLAANSIGGGAGLAGGGLVTGPGTATSDSIPARLSAGEFVVRAAAVQSVGINTLAAINRGLRIPSINGLSIPRFAEGGLVQTPGGGKSDFLGIGIGLDEGLILKHLKSKTAGRVILQHLSQNPKAATRALQRAQ